MINEPLFDLNEGSAEPEFYFVRRKGTVGLTHELGRATESSNDTACLYLFEDQLSALEHVNYCALYPLEWELASSKEFGGVASLVQEASKLPAPTPNYVAILGPMAFAPFAGGPIEYAINVFESSKWAEQWGSGRPRRPFWLLSDSSGWASFTDFCDVLVIPIRRVKAVCLFKTEMDAEEFRHSLWVSADEWKSDGPVGSLKAAHVLKKFSDRGLSHAVINPPPGSIDTLRVTPMEVVIDHVAEKGHIRDLD